MTAAIIWVSILTLITKLLESLARYIKFKSIYQERNIIMRFLMERIGIGSALGLGVLFEVGLIVYTVFLMLEADTDLMDYILFFSFAPLVMYIQISEARYYWNGKRNWLIRKLYRVG